MPPSEIQRNKFQRSRWPLQPLASPTAESSGTSQGERCLHLAYGSPPQGTWIFIAQGCLPRCHGPAIWSPSNLPSKCDCGSNFTVEHALSCAKRGFPCSGTMKFVISRLTSSQKYIMKYALNWTCSQPCQTNCLELPPTHRTGRGSTSRQTECGVGDLRRHFLMYESSTPTPPPTGIRHLLATENMRGERNEHTHRGYSKWSIRLSLHLFFFLPTGGMGREATCFYKRLASMLAQKWDYSHRTTLCWLRCWLTFSLICSAIQSLWGAIKIFSTSCCPLPSSNRPRHYWVPYHTRLLNPLFHLKFPFF